MGKLNSLILWRFESLGARIISKLLWPPSAASAVVVEDGKLLTVDAGEYLMLPGGILERGETLRETAVREVKEETGLEVEIIGKIEESSRDAGVEATFAAEVTSGELKGSWEGKPEWIPLEKAGERRWRFNRDIDSLLEKAEKHFN
ncbi:MAG: NUDIX domain-containing protein [Candidatus Nanohaloarchaea archaeon]